MNQGLLLTAPVRVSSSPYIKTMSLSVSNCFRIIGTAILLRLPSHRVSKRISCVMCLEREGRSWQNISLDNCRMLFFDTGEAILSFFS